MIKRFSLRTNTDIILTSESAKSFASYIFLFLLVKFVEVRYTRDVSFEESRKRGQSLYEKFHIFSIRP